MGCQSVAEGGGGINFVRRTFVLRMIDVPNESAWKTIDRELYCTAAATVYTAVAVLVVSAAAAVIEAAIAVVVAVKRD